MVYTILMNKNETKNTEEIEFLNKFLQTPVGKKWYSENSIAKTIKSEAPDFLFKTNYDQSLAMEITKLIVKNKNLRFSQDLTRIGNQLCKEIMKKYNIKVSMLIDKYDKRKFSSNLADQINLAYDPGFSEMPPKDIFKAKLRKFIDKNIDKLRKNAFTKDWIEVCNEYYQISLNCFPSMTTTGKYDCRVNNAGWVKINPLDELQDCIDKKNKKAEKYRINNDKCFLLVIVPDSKIGNYCSFTDELLKHKFISNFDSVFLYEEDRNVSWDLATCQNRYAIIDKIEE